MNPQRKADWSDSPAPKNEPSDPKNRRRLPKLLIYPEFQLKLIGLNLGILFLTFLGFWVTSQEIIQGLAPMAKISGVELEFYQKYLAYHEQQFRVAYITAVLLAVLASGGVTLFLSHRVAGPIVRLRHFLRATQKGDAAPLTFRDGDFFNDLPPLVNETVESLRRRKS